MMNSKEISELLIKLSGPAGKGCLGYLPQMFFTKWCIDNKTLPEVKALFHPIVYNGKLQHLPEGNKNLLQLVSSWIFSCKTVMLARDVESKAPCFEDVEDDVFAESMMAQTEVALMSVNLAEDAVPREAVVEGFDLFLRHLILKYDMGLYGLSESAGIAEKIVAEIAEKMAGKVENAYDPNCKFGTLLSCIHATKKSGGECNWLYASISLIRAVLSGYIGTTIRFDDRIDMPITDDHGNLRRYGLVVSDLTDIYSDEELPIFQSDIHNRFNKYCPNLKKLTPSAAFCHAIASMGYRGRCILVGTDNGMFRGDGILAGISPEGMASLLAKDLLEAVIDVDVSSERYPSISTITNHPPRMALRLRIIKRIYVFNDDKPCERKGKILFVNAIETPLNDIISRVLACFENFADVRGFAAMVPTANILASIDKHILKINTLFIPKQYTACIENPKKDEIGYILRDIKRLEEKRVLLMKNIEEIVESLMGEK